MLSFSSQKPIRRENGSVRARKGVVDMEYAIKVEGLCKRYDNVWAVRDLDILVPYGGSFGLLGANGAGKSTAIECMLGTKKSDGGDVSILGMNPCSDRKRVFERVGVQFQESSCQDKITVKELCEVTSSLYRVPADYEELLRKFGISEKSKSVVGELSGGQRQRLFTVLALIPEPEVVFLDELTTGLDSRARREVIDYIRELKQNGMTMLLTSHFMDEVEALCDRVCVLKEGRAVFCGTVAEAVAATPFETFEDAYLWFTQDEEGENEGV